MPGAPAGPPARIARLLTHIYAPVAHDGATEQQQQLLLLLLRRAIAERRGLQDAGAVARILRPDLGVHLASACNECVTTAAAAMLEPQIRGWLGGGASARTEEGTVATPSGNPSPGR